jgi:transcriptional regulator with XRE-family HTH domain
MKSSKDLGQIIKNLRINKSLTQEQLANLLKITPQAISKWENGESYPDLPILDKLAEIFEITLDYLIKDITESNKKNEYRIYETIENNECSIILNNLFHYPSGTIVLTLKNKSNNNIVLKPEYFLLLNNEGNQINSKKDHVYDNYGEDVVGKKHMHEIPSFLPPQSSVEVKLVFESFVDVQRLWFDIPHAISKACFIIRGKSFLNSGVQYSYLTPMEKDDIIDYYNFNYVRKTLPETQTSLPKINEEILSDLIIPKKVSFYKTYSHLFDQEIINKAVTNDEFVDFDFTKKHIADPLKLREIVKNNWELIEKACDFKNCSIVKFSNKEDFMDLEIIEKIIMLTIKLKLKYKDWTLEYISSENIEKLKPYLIQLTVFDNLILYKSKLNENEIKEILNKSPLNETNIVQIKKYLRYYENKIPQETIDRMLNELELDDLESLRWIQKTASKKLFSKIRDEYFKREHDKIDKLKSEFLDS